MLSVNLEGQHGTLMAGSIVANLLSMLARVEMFCAGGLLLALIGQWVVLDPHAQLADPRHPQSALYLAAVAIVLYDWLKLGPQIRTAREEYIDNADDPDVANPAKERFDAFHKESVSLLMLLLALLLGMILFSAGIAQPSHYRDHPAIMPSPRQTRIQHARPPSASKARSGARPGSRRSCRS